MLLNSPDDKRFDINGATVAFVLIFIGGMHAYVPQRRSWMVWATALIGVWVAASPWVFDFTQYPAAFRNSLAVGIGVAAASLWAVALCERTWHRRLLGTLHWKQSSRPLS